MQSTLRKQPALCESPIAFGQLYVVIHVHVGNTSNIFSCSITYGSDASFLKNSKITNYTGRK